MAHLTTEWTTDSEAVAELLTFISGLPQYSAERYEAEAGLHMLQARFAWRRADQIRGFERDREKRRSAREARKSDVSAPSSA